MMDIERARKETRWCEERIYFDNAGASLMPHDVSDSLHDYLSKEERFGGYRTAEMEKDALEKFYTVCASLIQCNPDEIAFLESASRAWNMAFSSVKFKPGDKILTTMTEYGSNMLSYLYMAKSVGVEICFIPDDACGQLSIEALKEMIDDKVKLISINHIPTCNGLVNPAMEVGRVANDAGILYLLDACQSVGQMQLNVKELGCDILTATGRKFLRGPRGTGFLYVKDSILDSLDPPMIDHRSADLLTLESFQLKHDSRRFEFFECSYAGKVGLGAAINYALGWGVSNIQERVFSLAALLRKKLEGVDGVSLTDIGKVQCGIVTFVTMQMEPELLAKALASHGISVGVSSGAPSLVCFSHHGLRAVVRASLHYYNTEEEIESFIEVLSSILNTYPSI